MAKWKKLLLYAAPIPMAFALSDHSLADFGKMLVGGLVFWIPYWLACWLSEEFTDLPATTGGRLTLGMDINPCTNRYETVLKDESGRTVMY